MTDAIRSEWIKLRSARSNLVMMILGLAIPLVISVLVSALADWDFSGGEPAYWGAIFPAYMCVFFAGVVGVLGIGQEYRHNTIRTTFTAEPRRSRVLTAKLIVTTAFGMGICVLSMLLNVGVARLILLIRGEGMPLPGDVRAAALGQIVLGGLFTLAGFGLGAILRQPAAGIPILLLWPFVVEPILAGVMSLIWSNDAARWLPFNAGLSIAAWGERGSGALGRLTAGVYFTAFVAALVGLGWLLVERRDA